MIAPTGPTSNANTFRALIVGLGSVGQRHARNLRALLGDAVTLLAHRVVGSAPLVSDTLAADPSRRPEEEYEIEVFAKLDEALNCRPDAVWICNPTSQHLETALRCASAGCDLFLEKPISDSCRDVDQLVTLVAERSLVVGVSSQLRFHPILRRLKAVVERRELGAALAVRAEVGEYLPGFHPYEDYRFSYAARRSLGGGVVLTLIHDLDYLIWAFGFPRRIYAIGGNLSSLEVDVDDVASILMECRVENTILPVHLQMDYVRRPPRRSCNVLCDGGSVDIDLRTNRLQLTDSRGQIVEVVETETFDRNQLFLDQMTDFLDARRLRRPPSVTLNDGIQALRAADAVRASMLNNSLVELP